MECERPVTIHDPSKSVLLDKYGTDLNVIKVPCGKCPACQQSRRLAWFYRLKVESNNCVSSYVVTLTYNDLDLPELITDDVSSIQYHPIKYADVQGFHKRLRKRIGPFRFFAVCEYGSEHLRPHYHICYFFDRAQDYMQFSDAVFVCWFPHTRITIDVTNDKACNYILKYCLALIDPDVPDCFRPMIRCSNRPYIGYQIGDNPEVVQWFIDHESDLSHYCGYQQRLPRIYRDKFFDDVIKRRIKQNLGQLINERAAHKLDQQISYDCKHGTDIFRPSLHEMSRSQFNLKVKQMAKLKSLK